jgi:hypothetical protein
MMYESLAGPMLEAEPWSPGPLSGTIWALRPDGTPLVIHLGPVSTPKPIELVYDYPPPPIKRPPADLIRVARDVLFREWRTSSFVARDWYGRKYLAKESDHGLQKPTEGEVKAAHQILDLLQRHTDRRVPWYDGHYAKTMSVASDRVFKWWKETPGVYREVVDLWKAPPKPKRKPATVRRTRKKT